MSGNNSNERIKGKRPQVKYSLICPVPRRENLRKMKRLLLILVHPTDRQNDKDA